MYLCSIFIKRLLVCVLHHRHHQHQHFITTRLHPRHKQKSNRWFSKIVLVLVKIFFSSIQISHCATASRKMFDEENATPDILKVMILIVINFFEVNRFEQSGSPRRKSSTKLKSRSPGTPGGNKAHVLGIIDNMTEATAKLRYAMEMLNIMM
jgi:hypothetical protein